MPKFTPTFAYVIVFVVLISAFTVSQLLILEHLVLLISISAPIKRIGCELKNAKSCLNLEK